MLRHPSLDAVLLALALLWLAVFVVFLETL